MRDDGKVCTCWRLAGDGSHSPGCDLFVRPNAPYDRADGKVVRLGEEIPAPSSEVLLFEELTRRPGHHGEPLVRCPLCGSVVEMPDAYKHAAWHRELLTETTDGDQVTTVIDATPAERVLRDLGAASSEVSTNDVLDALVEERGLTFEGARDEVYRLLESGRAILTAKYKLRLR